jgi:CRISPR-associated endonuclease/helicase Cas3
MENIVKRFALTFEALTGHEPFPWQVALYSEWFAKGAIPASCSLPTGLGKTNVIAIWLIGLAYNPGKLPRRLVYVVNRRTVVDQATREAEKFRKRLSSAGMVSPLQVLCGMPHDTPLAISTLRGQFADNGEWMADPSRPAIIIGTVDMIGSRLLFSGYGRGFKTRPLHAGFLGQDALLIHDEAHLEPAFQTLLEEIQAEQNGQNDSPTRSRDLKPIHVLALSATTRSGAAAFSLTDDDRANLSVKQRIEAVKRLTLVAMGEKEELEERILDSAKKLTGAVLVFVRSVESAFKIAAALDRGENKGRVVALTGTMRGKERDELVNDSRFQRFLGGNGAQNAPPVFLVCTSAGEVGVNISADHCVCDLSTYESMAQRFGRVNRFGVRSDSTITVVHDTEFDTEDKTIGALESARAATLALLDQLPKAGPDVYDASPAALESLPAAARTAAYSPPPKIRVATTVQFDAWSLTSIREPIAARPPVVPYLHGEVEWQPPETHLAWRDERDFTYIADPDDFLEKFPLRPREVLRDTTKRIAATLAKLLAAKTEPITAWLISENGSVSRVSLLAFAREDAALKLANATLILPVAMGGLENGLFTGKGDAADVSGIVRYDSDARDATADLVTDISADNDDEPRYQHWCAPSEAQQPERPLAPARGIISLAEHTAAVVANALAIAGKLDLSAEVQAAIAVAAEHHDDGKACAYWQRAIGNRDYPNTILAKPAGNSRSFAENYRHEFGSLALLADAAFTNDLAAHIVAAHHGRARPCFPAGEIFDPERSLSESLAVARAVSQRFAAFQHKYGRWGLAYIESILRAADYAASAGLIASTPTTPASPSSGEPSALLAREVGTVSLALAPTNPGHYFACCGLFELASRLHPQATAHFECNRFVIHAPTTLSELLDSITNARIDVLDPDDRTASPLIMGEPFSFRIDWWKTTTPSTSALKVWAGTMEAPRISKAMQRAIDVSKGAQVLFDVRVAFDSAGAANKVEPFYFDANRGPNADSRDVGFSPNDLGLETLAAPAVEFLCLVGLQRAIPRPVVDRLFDYHLWRVPIPISLLVAAVNGLIHPQQHHAYRFESWYRTSQRKHKAFLAAKPINQGDTR